MQPKIVSQKALDAYYTALADYQQHGVVNEQAIRLAFSTLLDSAARIVGWTLVLEQSLANRKRPDGTGTRFRVGRMG